MTPTASTTSAAALLTALLRECVEKDASDLHLAPGQPPYLRVHGVLQPQEKYPAMAPPLLEAIAAELGRGFDTSALQRTGSLDGAMTAADGTRFRFNVFRRQGHLGIAIRKLEDRFRSLTELGLPDMLYQLCDLPDGLVVVCGPTGSGKSTTLATLLDRINRTRRCHMITIEDPIEYIHKPIQSLVSQRQIGSDASSFNDALVASLRQDPDVILVGEIRDLNTIRTAITAAETGHLVFTTVHAGDTVGAIERLVSVFPAEEQFGVRRQLSLVLKAILAQHLLIADGQPPARSNGQAEPVRRRRVVSSEVLMVTPAVAHLIATGKSAQIYSSMETGAGQGMQTLDQDLARLWTGGWISETTALAYSRNPAILRDRAALLKKPPARAGGAR
jgi:twitching motility protein PilT